MDLEFSGEIWHWRGPAPFHFVTVPTPQAQELADIAPLTTYGWGVVPVEARIGGTTFTTSLFPKDGGYVVPLKAAVRSAEHLDIGDVVTVRLSVKGG